ncbi:hypothetical protein U1Q18_030574 [Sarracenia purpurea var. burkii]
MASKVLMVAEKPSIALSIASVLSGGRMSSRRGSTEVHEFDGTFLGFHAHYKVTSVIGHVFRFPFFFSFLFFFFQKRMVKFHFFFYVIVKLISILSCNLFVSYIISAIDQSLHSSLFFWVFFCIFSWGA